jgi:hypothetical protein
MKKFTTPFAVAMGAALISSVSATTVNAETNPFGATELSSGYMQLAAAEMACGAGMKMEKPKTEAKATKATEGKCGDMMDGDKMKKGMESSCGAMMKGKEGSCGDMHGAMMKEGACGAMAGMGDMKGKEGSCGDQCKDNMKNCPDAKNKEGACGAKMEGCGEDMKGCGEMSKGKDGACGAAMSGVKPSAGKPLDNSPLYDVHPPKTK